MSIELSPSQERRLHSILDRGLDALHESSDSMRESQVVIKPEFNFSSSFQETTKTPQNQAGEPERAKELHSEILNLREKLAVVEAKMAKSSDSFSMKSSKKAPSPGPSIKYSQTSSRGSSASKRSAGRNDSKERIRSIENSEKELSRLERSITPSPSKTKTMNNSRKIEKIRILVEKERKTGEKLRKENETLRKELGKRDEMKNVISKLQEDYNELAISFERSEAVRKKQKELIAQLKNEIKSMNGENVPDHLPSKKKNKRK